MSCVSNEVYGFLFVLFIGIWYEKNMLGVSGLIC